MACGDKAVSHLGLTSEIFGLTATATGLHNGQGCLFNVTLGFTALCAYMSLCTYIVRVWVQTVHNGVLGVATFAFLYLVGVTIARHRLVALPVRSYLISRVSETSAWADASIRKRRARTSIQTSLDAIDQKLTQYRFLDYILWTGSVETEAAVRLNAAVDRICWALRDYEVDGRLRAMQLTLRGRLQPGGSGLNKDRQTFLFALDNVLGKPRGMRHVWFNPYRLRPHHKRGAKKALLEQEMDGFYCSPAFTLALHWHRKAIWLTGTALVIGVMLAGAFGHWQFMAVASAGAFLGRLWQIVTSKRNPQNYQTEWTILMLAPAAGALAGFGGMLLVELLASFGVLADSFKTLWEHPNTTMSLGVAFLLGFSTRFLGRIAGPAEATLGTEENPSIGAIDLSGGAEASHTA